METEVGGVENVRRESQKWEKEFKGSGRCWVGAGRGGELHALSTQKCGPEKQMCDTGHQR